MQQPLESVLSSSAPAPTWPATYFAEERRFSMGGGGGAASTPGGDPWGRNPTASPPSCCSTNGAGSSPYYGSMSPTRAASVYSPAQSDRGYSEPPLNKLDVVAGGVASLDDVYLGGGRGVSGRTMTMTRRRPMDVRRTPSGRPVRVRGVAYTFIRVPRPHNKRHRHAVCPRVRSASCDVLAVGDFSDELKRSLSESKTESEEESSEWRGFHNLCSDWKRSSVLLSIAIVDFTSFLCLSIMAPFFPAEASARGVSQSVSGLIFSCYALVCFLVSPTLGKIMPKVGSKFMFVCGTFISGSCCVIFGFLDRIPGRDAFVALCFVVRCLEAVGAAAFATAGFTLVAELFPDNVGAVMGLLETFVGLGLSIGPAIGGALYDLDGYYLPFLVLGSLMLLSVPLNMALLPPDKHLEPVIRDGTFPKFGMLAFLREPKVAMLSLSVVVLSADWSYLDPTLQPHLEQFQLSANQLGLLFLLASGTYAFSSPIWGWVSDRWINGWSLVSSGLIFLGVILLFLGPSPWIPYLPDALWLNVLCLGLMGMTIALGLVPTFQLVLDAASDAGYEENLATYSLVSGVWSSVYSLGEVLGPAFGGVLMDRFGFGVASTLFGITTISLGLVIACFNAFFVNDVEEAIADGANEVNDVTKSVEIETPDGSVPSATTMKSSLESQSNRESEGPGGPYVLLRTNGPPGPLASDGPALA